MLKSLALLLFALLFLGCSRSPDGLYQSVGSEDKFRVTLELKEGGQAHFVTRSNVGDPKLDRAFEATMTVANARWVKDGGTITVTGARGDGKTVTYQFAPQANGDLIWTNNGARLVKSR